MSIFSVNDMKETSEELVEKYYRLEWDFVRGKKIKLGLIPRVFPEDQIRRNPYYNPGYLFYIFLFKALRTAANNTRGFRGDFKLNQIEESNLRFRFKNIIKDCGILKYKGTDYVRVDPYDDTTGSLKNQIINMMYDYIIKETNKSRYFKHILV